MFELAGAARQRQAPGHVQAPHHAAVCFADRERAVDPPEQSVPMHALLHVTRQCEAGHRQLDHDVVIVESPRQPVPDACFFAVGDGPCAQGPMFGHAPLAPGSSGFPGPVQQRAQHQKCRDQRCKQPWGGPEVHKQCIVLVVCIKVYVYRSKRNQSRVQKGGRLRDFLGVCLALRGQTTPVGSHGAW
ncbi:hypothetical protein FQZ97_988850 [compost metagenome]